MWAFAMSNGAAGLFLAVLMITIGFLLFRWHRYLRRQSRNLPMIVETPRPDPKQQGPSLDSPGDKSRWEVEMHETARDLSAQLDTKMAALQQLIRQADRASARLEAILEAGGATPPDLHAGYNSQPVGRTDGLIPPAPGDPGGDPDDRSAVEDRYEQICSLADRGLRSAEIASRVGIPVGEINLILGLRKKQ